MTDHLDRDIARGKQAEILLKSELLNEAFETLRAEYLKAWESTGARDTDARERLWQAFQIVGKVKTHLHQAVDSGKLAHFELNARG